MAKARIGILPPLNPKLEQLCEQGLPVVMDGDVYDYWLTLRPQDGALKVQSSHPRGMYFVLDFLKGPDAFRLKSGRHLISRAFSKNKGRVLDLTGGLLRDALVLASIGHRVLSVERDLLVYSLASDALERARRGGSQRLKQSLEKLELRLAKGQDALQAALHEEQRWDAIYIDPLFPLRAKSSKVKKGMSFLQDYLGIPADEAEARTLCEMAKNFAKNRGGRVVVKRPKAAGPLSDDVSLTIKGESTRFDIYIFS